MKFNQFAPRQVSLETQIQELINLEFLTNSLLEKDEMDKIWLHFLKQVFTQAQSPTANHEQIADLLASNTQNVFDFLNEHEITTNAFYNVALQLLGFEVDLDFELANPLASMDKMQLFHVNEINSTHDLITACYYLLLTYTKGGQNYLDYLATLGYFVPLYGRPAGMKPIFFNGQSQPVFNTKKLIKEVVYVESDLNTDQDGQRDLLKVEIIRPAETNFNLQVPAIYTASPYNQGVNEVSSDKMLHNVNQPLTTKEENNTTFKDIAYQPSHIELPKKREIKEIALTAESSFGRESSYTLNDYLLARGFAVVYAAGIGTMDSDGVRTCGSTAETSSTVAIIEWLAGERTAFTNKTDNIEIKAWWCNKHVAMTGKSYLGTLATAAATTGTPALKTIISEAAISSWYDYYREGGLVISPGGYVGEDADVLAELCFSRRKKAADYLKIQPFFTDVLKQMAHDQDRITGNYTTFWDERNYLHNLDQIKAKIVMVHGLNDWNVKPKNVFNLWHGLDELPVVKKLILHQGQHIYINNLRSLDFSNMMNLWLSNQLYNVDNQAEDHLPDLLVQDNTQPNTWITPHEWHKYHNLTLNLQENVLSTQDSDNTMLSFKDWVDQSDFEKYDKNIPAWMADLISKDASALENNRLIFKTAPLSSDVTISGAPTVSLRLHTDSNHGLVSAMLVDFGEEKRLNADPSPVFGARLGLGFEWREEPLKEFTYEKNPSPWKLIAKGHLNLQNKTALWKNDQIIPGESYDFEFKLQPTYYHLLKNHQLGLIVYATDFEMTQRGNEHITYTLDLANSQLNLAIDKKEVLNNEN